MNLNPVPGNFVPVALTGGLVVPSMLLLLGLFYIAFFCGPAKRYISWPKEEKKRAGDVRPKVFGETGCIIRGQHRCLSAHGRNAAAVCDTTTQPLKSKDDGRGGGPKHNLGKIILKKSRPKNS